MEILFTPTNKHQAYIKGWQNGTGAKKSCDDFYEAALIVPEGIVVVDFDGDNSSTDGNIYDTFIVNYLFQKYEPYWTSSREHHFHLYFKLPNDLKTIKNTADFYTVGGFQVDYRKKGGCVVVKENGKMRPCLKELTLEVLENLPELPILLYPLFPCGKNDYSFCGMKEHDGRNDLLFRHILSVYRKYKFNESELYEIGDFINNRLFTDPLSDKEIESFSARAKDYSGNIENIDDINSELKNKSVIYSEDYNSDIDLICFDDVEYKKASWLWYPYLPLGRLVLVVGDPGIGKSYLTIDWSSRVSRGEPFPFYDEEKGLDEIGPSKVIFQNGEDGIEDTIKERLIFCNANQKNIFIINEVDNPIFSLDDLERFEKALKEQNPKLVVIDPLQRYLGNISMNSATQVRQLLAPVGNLAIKYNCTILLVMHRNKGDKDDLYRALGSIDFVGIARSMLSIQKDESGNKMIVHSKSSLGKKGAKILYDILDDGVIYVDKIDNEEDGEDALRPREEAKEFILKLLEENNGCFGATEISKIAKEFNISSSTLNRAKQELNIKSFQVQGKWYWKSDFD